MVNETLPELRKYHAAWERFVEFQKEGDRSSIHMPFFFEAAILSESSPGDFRSNCAKDSRMSE